MISRIARDDSLARIRAEGGDYGCLMCALRDGRFGPLRVLHDDDRALVILPGYVTRWGHALVLLRAHVTSFSDVPPADWLHLAALARRAARAAETLFATRRCFVASTGSSGGELTQTSEHLHLHVIPVVDRHDRPGHVFSWTEGVLVADDREWQSLLAGYTAAWARVAP
ncbi:MAG: HIT family protein [Myxococcales bacterium]|nr:MAG: HIT family protein [Myxococcales bacterium]